MEYPLSKGCHLMKDPGDDDEVDLVRLMLEDSSDTFGVK